MTAAGLLAFFRAARLIAAAIAGGTGARSGGRAERGRGAAPRRRGGALVSKSQAEKASLAAPQTAANVKKMSKK